MSSTNFITCFTAGVLCRPLLPNERRQKLKRQIFHFENVRTVRMESSLRNEVSNFTAAAQKLHYFNKVITVKNNRLF